ncbi:MAG: type II secretion system protein [Angustibacter sp.]
MLRPHALKPRAHGRAIGSGPSRAAGLAPIPADHHDAGGRPGRGDAGFTLVEAIVAMSIFSVIIAIFAVAVTDWTGNAVRTSRVSDQTTTSRVIYDALDKQVPSAAAVNRPVKVGPNWYLEFRTDATNPRTCTQWVLRTGTGEVAYRTWPTDVAGTPTPSPWKVIETRVQDPGSFTPPRVPFQMLPTSPWSSRQQVLVDLTVRRGNGPPTDTRGVFVARNSSPATATDRDANSDGVSDTQVCQDISGARP